MKQPVKLPLRERASCATCEFGEMHPDNDALMFCRRRAPVIANSARQAIFPTVHEDDWCGDFREELDA